MLARSPNACRATSSACLTWSSCSVAGAKTVTLPLDFVDGVATIDLAGADRVRAAELYALAGEYVSGSVAYEDAEQAGDVEAMAAGATAGLLGRRYPARMNRALLRSATTRHVRY